MTGSNGGLHVSETPTQLDDLLDQRRGEYIIVNRNSDGQDIRINRAFIQYYADDSWTFGSG